MFVANHLSMIDIMLVLMAVRNPFVFVGKRELEEIPVFNYIYRRAAILVDRESAKSRKNVYHRAQRKLDLGYSVCIYPEGSFLIPTSIWLRLKMVLSVWRYNTKCLLFPLRYPIVKNAFLFSLVTNTGQVPLGLFAQLFTLPLKQPA